MRRPLRARPLSGHRSAVCARRTGSSGWSARRWRAASPWSSCATTRRRRPSSWRSAARLVEMLRAQRRAADRQQPPRRRRWPPAPTGSMSARPTCRAGRSAGAARAGCHPRLEHHRRRTSSRRRRSGMPSTIWASGRSSPPAPSSTRRRPWGWMASPRSARARSCPSSPSAGSAWRNAAATIRAGRRRHRGGLGDLRRRRPSHRRPGAGPHGARRQGLSGVRAYSCPGSARSARRAPAG